MLEELATLVRRTQPSRILPVSALTTGAKSLPLIFERLCAIRVKPVVSTVKLISSACFVARSSLDDKRVIHLPGIDVQFVHYVAEFISSGFEAALIFNSADDLLG